MAHSTRPRGLAFAFLFLFGWPGLIAGEDDRTCGTRGGTHCLAWVNAPAHIPTKEEQARGGFLSQFQRYWRLASTRKIRWAWQLVNH